jgi:hypothetical protein
MWCAGEVSRGERTERPFQLAVHSRLTALSSHACAGFWDPIGLAKAEFWDNTNEETIGWLRHSEIKHGRVAMAAFVGYCVQANGFKFPWAPFDSITATSPPEQWDALPDVAKWQIILGVGFLEWWSEIRFDGTPHYMKGGKPGYVPPFDATPEKLPHWVGLNLYDPFKWHANVPAEKKQSLLVTEINNGRLAMCAAAATPDPTRLTPLHCGSELSRPSVHPVPRSPARCLRRLGIFGFLSEAKVEGSVPLLKGIVSSYAGDPMAPFL